MFTRIERIGKPALFLGFIGITVLVLSCPAFSPFAAVSFSAAGLLIRGAKLVKQILLLFTASFTAVLIIFCNPFFIHHYRLLLLTCLYFSMWIVFDCIAVYQAAVKSPSYALPLLFFYSICSRMLLSASTVIFPFYWTLSMQLLPVMNPVTLFVLPVFCEGIGIVSAAALYLYLTKKVNRYIILQAAAIIVLSIIFSLTVKQMSAAENRHTNLTCTLVQGGYSAKDYTLVENYPFLGNELARRYLRHLEESPQSRLTVLPESALPVHQTLDSPFLQTIKDIAYTRNAYIMASMLLKEETAVYNAIALINPEGQVQDIYRKRNVMLFVESNDFKQGTTKQTFAVDAAAVAPLICFDSVFLHNYIRDKRPDVYMVTSNDVFAEGTVVSRFHQAYSVINARMMGIPLIQLTQNGPSFYVDSKGKLINLTSPHEKTIGLSINITIAPKGGARLGREGSAALSCAAYRRAELLAGHSLFT